MCLGTPAKVLSLKGDMALVDASGVRREISSALLASGEIDPGDYVLVHAGFAIAKITDEEEAETAGILRDLGLAGAPC